MNKKIICAALSAMLLSGLTACGGDDSSSTAATSSNVESSAAASTPDDASSAAEQPGDSSAPAEDSAAQSGETVQISFDYIAKDNIKIEVGTEADGVIAALGTYDKMFEAPSCAHTGTSNYYVYGGLQVVTYPDETDQNLNLIYEVDLLDDTVATNEGIRIGNTYEDMIAKYGTPDQESAVFAQYKTEGKAVQFFFDKDNTDVISEIVYTIILV